MIGKKIILFLIILLVVRNSSFIKKIGNDSFVPKEIYPVDAANYLLEKIDTSKMKLFNVYDDGAYLLFRNIPVFMDSRSDLYTKIFNKKKDIFNDYIEIMNTGSKDLLKKYEITHALLSKDANLTSNFKEQYKIEYEDEYFIIFSTTSFSMD